MQGVENERANPDAAAAFGPPLPRRSRGMSFGALQREAARRKRTDRRMIMASLVALLGLLAVFYNVLKS